MVSWVFAPREDLRIGKDDDFKAFKTHNGAGDGCEWRIFTE